MSTSAYDAQSLNHLGNSLYIPISLYTQYGLDRTATLTSEYIFSA